MKTLLFYTFFSALLLFGCRNEDRGDLPENVRELQNVTIFSNNDEALTAVNLRREIVFSDSLLLDEIPSVAVDDSGIVFFAGSSWNRRVVHVFRPDGSYVQSIGNYGEDKGEDKFLEINTIQIRNDSLYVFDQAHEQATIFKASSGEFLKAVDLNPRRMNTADSTTITWKPVWAREDGSFLVQRKEEKNPAYYPGQTLKYFRINRDREIVSDVILEQKDMRYLIGDYAGRPAPFTLDVPERSLLAISGNGELYSAWSAEFFIKVFDVNGNYLRAYYHPFRRAELNPEEVIHPRYSHNEQLRRIRESTEYPDKWPALYSILVDDKERIWVSTVIDDDEYFEWWIIDSDHVYAKFKWPREKPVKLIKNGFVYTVETNSSGFKEVVRYRVEEGFNSQSVSRRESLSD